MNALTLAALFVTMPAAFWNMDNELITVPIETMQGPGSHRYTNLTAYPTTHVGEVPFNANGSANASVRVSPGTPPGQGTFRVVCEIFSPSSSGEPFYDEASNPLLVTESDTYLTTTNIGFTYDELGWWIIVARVEVKQGTNWVSLGETCSNVECVEGGSQ